MSEKKRWDLWLCSGVFQEFLQTDLSLWIILTLIFLPWEKVRVVPCLIMVEVLLFCMKLLLLVSILLAIPSSSRKGRSSGTGVFLGSLYKVLMAVNSRWLYSFS